MALSEEEQRLLAQMEAALAAEDPKLASALRGTTTRRLHRRRAAIAGVGFLIGVACLIGGMEVSPALSIAGFVIMLAASVIAVTSWRHVGEVPASSRQTVRSAQGDRAFMDKIEERWRRRQDEGQ